MARKPQPLPGTSQEEQPNPKQPSSDYTKSLAYWQMVSAILSGVDAMRTPAGMGVQSVAGPALPYANLSQLNATRRNRSGSESPYLPQFPAEDTEDYEYRRKWAPLCNIYTDISYNLSSKPFSKECVLEPDSSQDLLDMADNIDGQGNSLHVFAAQTFKDGIDYGIDWIWIDYPKTGGQLSLAQERDAGVRPYWVHIPAVHLLAVYSDFIGGKEEIVHARIYDPIMRREGYDEICVERVRIFTREPQMNEQKQITGYDLPTFEVWECQTTRDAKTNREQQNWVKVEEGALTIGVIPLVPFATGKRRGSSWYVRPPLKDIAYLQVEEFQQESNLKNVKELTAFPMLTGNGVQPVDAKGEDVKVIVGPHAVLFAPPQLDGRAAGNWQFIEPGAASLTFLKTDLDALRAEMRNLGMQPMADANLTVVTTANLSMKAHNAVQAWAMHLKNSLENAWAITCMWLGRMDEKPIVSVHVDFAVELQEGPELTTLQALRTAKDLSQVTYWEELRRRGILSDEFDPDEEKERLAEEIAPLVPEEEINPITGEPIQKPSPPANVHLVTGKDNEEAA